MSDVGNNTKRNVVIAAGMPRAGSSWLYRNLSEHPSANVSSLKEINYFSINFDRGTDWLDSLYNKNNTYPRFDISPFYFLDPEFETNVKKADVNAKVVIILREPNHWVRSFYYQIKSFTPNMPAFSEFIKEHTVNFDNRSKTVRLKDFDFLNRVNELVSAFKGNVMLVNFDLIKDNPVKLLQEIEKFSGLPAHYNQENIIDKQVNASQGNFSWLYYISTNRHLRSFVHKLPFPGLIKFIQKILYKEDKANLKGIAKNKQTTDKDKYELLANEQDIDSQFPPVFKNTFFKDGDIVYM